MVFNMFILWIGVGVIIHLSVTGIYSMPCDAKNGWLEYEDKCLGHYSTAVSWSSANGTCSMLRQALLATVNSPEINSFVHTNLTSGSNVWIGLSIPNVGKPNWKWSDGGNTSSYTNWTPADVDSACAAMKYENGRYWVWHTIPCTYSNSYICEKEMSEDNCTDWLSFETHCYLIIQRHAETNMAAARNCWQYGAYLISINSEQEADFIYNINNILTSTVYWIGLSPLKWVSGVPYHWNNWGDSGPSLSTTNGCVFINGTNGKWFCGQCEYGIGLAHNISYICQRDIDFSSLTVYSQTSTQVSTSTKSVLGDSYTEEFDELIMSNTQTSTGNSKQLLITVVIPAVCGGLVVIIVIIVIIIVIRRRRRSNGSNKGNPSQMNTTYLTDDITVGCDNEDIGKHQDQEKYIYDEAEVVQADNGTVVVNGDVYAIVDKDKIQNQNGVDNMVSKERNNTKQEIAQGHNHIIVGSDVYAIVDKNNVKHNKQQKPKQKKKKPQTPPKSDEKSAEIKSNAPGHIVVGTDVYAVVDKENVKPNKQQTTPQKKKKPPTPPKLEDKTEDINTNGQSHIVVGTDVYAVVDKEKVKPNKQQTSQQKKKKPPAPPNLENKTVAINEGNVYYNKFDMKTVPVTPTKRKPKVEKKTEDTGVVYADLDLTGSGSGDRQNGNNDEKSGVVYADVRG